MTTRTWNICNSCNGAIEEDYIVDGEPIDCEYIVDVYNVKHLDFDLIARTVGDELPDHSCDRSESCGCIGYH